MIGDTNFINLNEIQELRQLLLVQQLTRWETEAKANNTYHTIVYLAVQVQVFHAYLG